MKDKAQALAPAAPVGVPRSGAWDPALPDTFIAELRLDLEREQSVVLPFAYCTGALVGLLTYAFLPSPGSFFLGLFVGSLSGRSLVRALYERHRDRLLAGPIAWREVRRLYRAAEIRSLDEPEARTHKLLPVQEKLERFRGSLQSADRLDYRSIPQDLAADCRPRVSVGVS